MLFPSLSPVAAPPGIDLRCCDIRDTLSVREVSLVHADPPWTYDNAGVRGNADDEYTLMGEAEIAAILDAAYDCAAPGARLVCWATWPKLMEFLSAGGAGTRWRYVTGGAWLKERQVGVGHHWRGQTEPALMFTKPGASPYLDRDHLLLNGYASVPEQHSRKPLPWLCAMLRAWTPPGGLVLDLWAGLAPMAAACALEGRRYVGAEIDPERHGRALTMLREVTP